MMEWSGLYVTRGVAEGKEKGKVDLLYGRRNQNQLILR
jgi:hypothetical protein